MDMTVLLILDLSATCETVSGSFLMEVAWASVPVTAPRLARPSHLCQRACYLPVLAGAATVEFHRPGTLDNRKQEVILSQFWRLEIRE